LSKSQLANKNEFSLVYRGSGSKSQSIRNVIVSRALKDCILQFIDGDQMDTQELDQEERDWLKQIWIKAGLIKSKPSELKTKVVPSPYISKKMALDRLKVIIGEVNAGNDSLLLLKELKILADKMHVRGWIEKDDLLKINQIIALGE
jgi:ribosomal protein L10